MAAFGRARWLKVDLLLRLMLPLLVIVAATAGLGTYTAQRLTSRVYDRWLLDAARSVVAQIRFEHGAASLDLPPVAESILLFDENDQVYFSVSQGGRLVAGSLGIPLAGENESRIARGVTYDSNFSGQPVRVARVSVDPDDAASVTVLVAETGLKRERSAQELIAVLWPMLALVVAAGLSILLAVRGAVRPLQVIASRWNERPHMSLQPISDDDVPRELLPFTAALNDLLARIRGLLARERQFAATAAHQLRTPLAGLQLGLSRAVKAPDIEQAREVMGELSQTTNRTARIVQQLLALGRIDPENRGDMDFVACDLVAVAEDVGSAYADQALAKGVDLELVTPIRPVPALVVPDLVAEALANLLDNALRYTPAAGRIVVEVHAQPTTIRVSDSGPGIPEDEREAVLGRFARGRSATGDGSGLGLAIVSEIALLHHASVCITDSAWGGTSVSVNFAPAATSTDRTMARSERCPPHY
jgi:two-component system sensor histidine kinase TctE